MIHLHEAQRVRVQMKIGNEEVFMLWTEDDLNTLKNRNPNIARPVWKMNNPVPNGKDSEDEDNIPDSEHYPDAFLSDWQWNPIHLKRIVHILDIFKISQKAYHELRMTSR